MYTTAGGRIKVARRPSITRRLSARLLPVPLLARVNAALNGLSALLLATGYFFIRRKDRRTHRFIMLSACTTSAQSFAC